MKAALSKRATWMCFLQEERDLCWGELAGAQETLMKNWKNHKKCNVTKQ